MTLSRRHLLRTLGAAACVSVVVAVEAQPASAIRGPAPLTISVRPIPRFHIREPERTQFGALTFRGGLELTNTDERFGGFSGLWRSADGSRLVAVTDKGDWLTADVVTEKGRVSGFSNAVMAPLLGANGSPLAAQGLRDVECLTLHNGVAYVGIERRHQVMRFAFGKDGVLARGSSLGVPDAIKRLPRNQGLEAIGLAPSRSPIAGAVVAIAERAVDQPDAATLGWILTGPRQGAFEVARSANFDITDLAFLPNGDLLLLERSFSWFAGVKMRLRRIAGDTLKPGARLDGSVLLQADMGDEIDNMEGLSVHEDAQGKTILTLISDNNFSSLQRTLMLEFELAGATL